MPSAGKTNSALLALRAPNAFSRQNEFRLAGAAGSHAFGVTTLSIFYWRYGPFIHSNLLFPDRRFRKKERLPIRGEQMSNPFAFEVILRCGSSGHIVEKSFHSGLELGRRFINARLNFVSHASNKFVSDAGTFPGRGFQTGPLLKTVYRARAGLVNPCALVRCAPAPRPSITRSGHILRSPRAQPRQCDPRGAWFKCKAAQERINPFNCTNALILTNR